MLFTITLLILLLYFECSKVTQRSTFSIQLPLKNGFVQLPKYGITIYDDNHRSIAKQSLFNSEERVIPCHLFEKIRASTASFVKAMKSIKSCNAPISGIITNSLNFIRDIDPTIVSDPLYLCTDSKKTIEAIIIKNKIYVHVPKK